MGPGALDESRAYGRGDALDESRAYGESGEVPAGRLPILRVVGQIRQMYIIAEGPAGLYLVDQHAAHERVLFEQMRRQQAGQTPLTQVLLSPALLPLGLREAGILGEHLPALQRAGFELEPFGEQTYLVRGVPAALALDHSADASPEAALLSILEELERGETPLDRDAEARVMAAVCKRAAVKAGQTLSHAEMSELIRRLEACDAPQTCPHGRPTMIHMSVDQLAKHFSRT